MFSSIKTTWITPDDLFSHIDLNYIESSSSSFLLPLPQWLQGLHYYDLGQVIDRLFSKPERVRICLRIIKKVKISKSETLFDLIKVLNDPRPLEAIIACERYLKGKIGDEELETAATAADDNIQRYTSSAAASAGAAQVAATAANASSTYDSFVAYDARSDCKQIFLEELAKFDWSKVEKEIRGHEVFGE